MSIRIQCPSCKQKLSFKHDLVGKRVKCPACRHVVIVPLQAYSIRLAGLSYCKAGGLSILEPCVGVARTPGLRTWHEEA